MILEEKNHEIFALEYSDTLTRMYLWVMDHNSYLEFELDLKTDFASD